MKWKHGRNYKYIVIIIIHRYVIYAEGTLYNTQVTFAVTWIWLLHHHHHHMASPLLTSLPTLYPHPYKQKAVTHLLFLLPFSFQRMQTFTFIQLPLDSRRGRKHTHTHFNRNT